MTSHTTHHAGHRPVLGRVREVLSLLLAALLAAVVGLVAQPFVPALTTPAQAVTATDYSMGNCAYRQGGAAPAGYANSLCWIDWSGITVPTSGSVNVTRKVGNYTLSFTLSRPQGSDATVTPTAGPMGDAAFGSQAFIPYAGDTQKPVLGVDHNGFPRQSLNLLRVQMTNIMLRDANGAVVGGYALTVADAEVTNTNEGISVNSGTADRGAGFARITPAGWSEGCGELFGYGWEAGLYNQNQQVRDFTCNGDIAGKNRDNTVGTFVATEQAPTDLTISTWGTVYQGFAVAISLARAGGSVTADTTYEKAVVGTATPFSLSARTSGGQAIALPADGSMTTFLRNTTGSGSTSQAGILPGDQVVYTSAAGGPDAALALYRYDPVWTCTMGTGAAQLIRAGNVPSGYTLTNNASNGTSTLAVSNPTNAPLDCDVNWMGRFKPASLTLGKTVSGNAANFPELAGRSYRLEYRCASNPATGFDAATFTTAYPGSSLSGSQQLTAGATATITSLPAGALCTLTETFPSGTVPAGPGLNLDQTWSGAGSDTATTTDNAVSTTRGSWTTRTRTVTLGTTPATDTANNAYTYRTGTIHVTKELLGDPVPEFAYPRTYDFSLTCDGTNIQNQAFSFQITQQADGSHTNGQGVDITVPVGHACYLTPLTGLSAAESLKYRFDGRTVTVDGSTVTEQTSGQHDGAYAFTVPDYAPGATPTTVDVHLAARYSYQLRDLKVVKQLAGAAAGSKDLAGVGFQAVWSCTWGASGQYSRSGTLAITPGQTTPAAITNVPVGARCTVYEAPVAPLANVQLKSTTVSFTDMTDTTTTLSNADAQNRPVATVQSDASTSQNRVVITNDYEPRLGTVLLTKAVVDNGLAAGSLPTSFTLRFECGSRSVVAANGSVTSIPIQGSIVLARDQSGELVASTGSSTNDALVNDQDGSLGVPYGNTCTFTEDRPEMPISGVQWTSNAAAQKLVVGPATVDGAARANVTITNTFTPAGQGLTINQRAEQNASLAEPISYRLACTNEAGTAIDLGADASFTLDEANPTHVVAAAKVPEGSRCTLSEVGNDDRTRTNGSTSFPITRTSELTMAADGSRPAVDATIADPGAITTQLVVGAASVLDIANSYDFVYGQVTAVKDVVFDPATQQYISDERKRVKQNRQFNLTLVCTPPGGTAQTTTAVVSEQTDGVSNAPLQLTGKVAVGSACTLSEGATTTSTGVTVTQQVQVNGGPQGATSQDFVVAEGTNAAVVTNTYARTMAHLELNKIARLPGNIAQQYADAGQQIDFFTHTFTMECRDPATGDGEQGALLGTYESTITGPGSTTFTDVPAGADCQIVGDHFGELSLALTDKDGVELEARLRPQQVRWVVDANDGTAFVQDEFPDDTTTSQWFPTVADSGETVNNVVDLVNTYDYVQTQIQMTKQVVGTPQALALLDAQQAYDFSYQCKGVGYTTSTIGQDPSLPTSLALGSFSAPSSNADGTVTRTWTSPRVSVPAGAWCSFTEQDVAGTPAQLTMTVNPDDTGASKPTVAGRAPGGSDPSTDTWAFTNRYEQRFVPVRLAMLQDGYLEGAAEAGYQLAVTCTDPASTTATLSVTLDEASSVNTVADAGAPQSGPVVNLPAGAECTLGLAGSPALAERGELEVTQGERSPFVQFGTWSGGTASEANPDVAPVELEPGQVTAEMKTYSYTFSLAPDLAVADGSTVAMTVAAEAVHPRATAQLSITKLAGGAVAKDARFTLSSDCFAEDVTLAAGETVTTEPVPVDSSCVVTEVDDGVASSEAQLSVQDSGELVDAGDPTNTPATGDTAGVHRVTLTVLPVTDPGDTSTSGAQWAVTLLNRFPAMEVTKTIAGAAVSQVTGAVADTAVLAPDATSMEVSYTIANTGAQELTGFTLVDESMAGRTLTRDGQRIVVGADGAIPLAFCGLEATAIASGASHTCTFTASIAEPAPGLFHTRGALVVTANAEGTSLTSQDSYGAVRPVLGALPQTGRQTLVLVIGLGLLVVGVGLWRRHRSGTDDGAHPGADTAPGAGE